MTDKDPIHQYRDNELNAVFHKNQDSFEKQLSFIAAGALGLSIGFIKDIVKPFNQATYKWLLGVGWSLLVVTLLCNCISHLLGAIYANRGISEINDDKYERKVIEERNKKIVKLNWLTVGIMILGITFILIFIVKNILL